MRDPKEEGELWVTVLIVIAALIESRMPSISKIHIETGPSASISGMAFRRQATLIRINTVFHQKAPQRVSQPSQKY